MAVKLNVVEPVEEPEEPEEDVIATVGEVMSSLSFMNCARGLRYPDVITPYRILSMVTISVSIASESSNPFTPCVSASLAAMLSTSLISRIWTPSSSKDATIAYVKVPIVKVDTSSAPSSSVNVAPSTATPLALTLLFATSLRSRICTPSSSLAVTIAYVLAPMENVSTPMGPSSVVNVAPSSAMPLAAILSTSLISSN